MKAGRCFLVRKGKVHKELETIALRSLPEGGSHHGVEFQDRYA